MAIAVRKIPSLGGDHRFLFGQGPHIDSLVGTGARRKYICPRIHKNVDQALSQCGSVHAARRGDDLQAHTGMNVFILEKLGKLPNVIQSAARTASNFRHMN